MARKKRRNKKTSFSMNPQKLIKVLIACFLLSLLFTPYHRYNQSTLEKRAVWLSYIDLSSLDYSSEGAFTSDFAHICNKAQKYSLNTLIVQVRAFGDALYPTKNFGFSKAITNHLSLDFDPLSIMIKVAHLSGLSLEAWVNPFRLSNSKKTYYDYLHSGIKRQWLTNRGYTLQVSKYEYMLNPANQEVQDYVVNGIQEILTRYNVDGIHFDDRLYPGSLETTLTRAQKQGYINTLVRRIHQETTKAGKTFGYSCPGNYDNCLNEGANVGLWLKKTGYIDYLMPQIYWSNMYGTQGNITLFSNRLASFTALKRQSRIKLYVGLALYNAGVKTSYDPGWSLGYRNITNQMTIIFQNNLAGYALFRYDFLKTEAGSKEMSNVYNAFDH